MKDVEWIKIATDIFDNDKIVLIESLPNSYVIITIWFKLLCLAGKHNNQGVFVSGRRVYTAKTLATLFHMKERTVTKALKIFEEFGMVEIIDGVITIPNWNKYQSLDKMEEFKEQNRKRVAKYREKQKQLAQRNNYSNVTVTQGNAQDIEKEEDTDVDQKKSVSVKETTPTLFERLLPEYIFSPLLVDKLQEWFMYKAERNEPYKEQGMKSLLGQIENHCSQFGDKALADLIDACMANGWKNIIFDRLYQQPAQNIQQPYHVGGGRRNVPPSGVDRLLEMAERGDFGE